MQVTTKQDGKNLCKLSVLMPCMNEEANVGYCIDQAKTYMREKGLNGQILVIDNASTDRSAEIAAMHGAEVITEKHKGYGYALRAGLAATVGEVIIFADSDSTYDLRHLDPFYMLLSEGKADVVIGDRFTDRMEKGAMPLLHRVGVPFLSWCGRLRYGTCIHDFHCGIRGIRSDALEKCSFHATGMEFATEMIAEACRKGLRILEVPVPYFIAKKERQKKLRPMRDGLRHMWYMIAGKAQGPGR